MKTGEVETSRCFFFCFELGSSCALYEHLDS
jgi:hypothetical protein